MDKADKFYTDLFDTGSFVLPKPSTSSGVEKPTESPDAIENYVEGLIRSATPRELNSELSQTIYYNSEELKIKLDMIKIYLNNFLFEKFPGKDPDVHSVKSQLVSEICHTYAERVKKGKSDTSVSAMKPHEYKDWQMKQLLDAILEVKNKTINQIKEPVKAKVKAYGNDPFEDNLPLEKAGNPKILELKIRMINALFEDLE